MQQVLDFIQAHPGGWALAIVFAAAALEYLVPPLPADTIVLGGSLLVVAKAHSFVTVAAVAIAGGALGAAIHFGLGVKLARPDGTMRGGRYVEKVIGKGNLEKFFAAFRKHGMWVIALNRAFPGVRAVTFFAAGAARMPFVKTMAFGLISNVLWSLAVLTLGVTLGGNWEKIEAAFGVYKTVVYSIFGAGLIAFVAYRVIRKRRRPAQQEEES